MSSAPSRAPTDASFDRQPSRSSVRSHSSPWRLKTSTAARLPHVDHDHAVLAHPHGVRRDGKVRGQGERRAAAQVEARAVAGAHDLAGLTVPLALAEGAVVVRAAVLDGMQLTLAVIQADRDAVSRNEAH